MGESKRRQNKKLTRFKELDDLFASFDIKYRSPGFDLHGRFIEAERTDNRLLEKYAEWVRLRPRENDYDREARTLVPQVSELVFKKLKKHGGLGQCVDTSNLLSRCLDNLGIFNYVCIGALNIEILSKRHLGKQYFWAFDSLDPGATQRGHVWVVAPPFEIIDVSIRAQGWPVDFWQSLPDQIISEGATRATARVEEVVAPHVLAEVSNSQGHAPRDLHFKLMPNLREITETFPGWEVQEDDVRVRYHPTAIGASDASLENMGTSKNVAIQPDPGRIAEVGAMIGE